MRVFDDGEACEQKRNQDCPDANRINRNLLQSPPKEKHHHGPERRNERD
jgi:hypothetical protein